jgi:hypothetical protein
MTGPTLEQLKSSAPPSESLWHFLVQLPGTMEAQVIYAMLIGGMIGMLAHYFVKWCRGEIAGSLIAYLFVDNPRRSMLAVATLIGVLFGEFSLSTFMVEGAVVSWGMVLFSGMKSGFLVDAVVNKGSRPEWTQAQRTAAAVEEAEKKI